MNAIEKLLQQMSLVPPSDQLDQRISEALGPPPNVRRGSRRPSWWITLLASAACLVVGILIGQQWQAATERDAETTVEETESPSNAIAHDTPADQQREMVQTVTSRPSNETKVSTGTFVLIDGKIPARWHRAITSKRMRLVDEQTGESSEIAVPIRRHVVVPSPGI